MVLEVSPVGERKISQRRSISLSAKQDSKLRILAVALWEGNSLRKWHSLRE